MGTVNATHGDLNAKGQRFAIVAARFNEVTVESLLTGALAGLADHGAAEQDITIVRVPGAFELPLIARKLAASQQFGAVIALGAVVRGGTPHFEYVCNEAASGLTRAALDSDVPVVFGVLTTDNQAQADERTRPDRTNKGYEAALVAIEMANLVKQLVTQLGQANTANS